LDLEDQRMSATTTVVFHPAGEKHELEADRDELSRPRLARGWRPFHFQPPTGIARQESKQRIDFRILDPISNLEAIRPTGCFPGVNDDVGYALNAGEKVATP
jgi:hypothetical protein